MHLGQCGREANVSSGSAPSRVSQRRALALPHVTRAAGPVVPRQGYAARLEPSRQTWPAMSPEPAGRCTITGRWAGSGIFGAGSSGSGFTCPAIAATTYMPSCIRKISAVAEPMTGILDSMGEGRSFLRDRRADLGGLPAPQAFAFPRAAEIEASGSHPAMNRRLRPVIRGAKSAGPLKPHLND